jgi:hypothetical protein
MATKFHPFKFFCVGLRFGLCLENLRFYDFLWLLPASFLFVWHNRKCKEFLNARCKARVNVRLSKLPMIRGGGNPLQALQFQKMAIRHKLPGWADISNYEWYSAELSYFATDN